MTGVMCDVSARMKGKIPEAESDSGSKGKTAGRAGGRVKMLRRTVSAC